LSINSLRPSSASQLDFAFEAFLHAFYSSREGAGLALARNALMGLCLYFPQLKSSMPLSRRAILGWEKLRPSVSHPPLSWPLTVVLAVKVVLRDPSPFLGFASAVALLLAWEAYLRIGEVCSLLFSDVLFHDVGAGFRLPSSVSSKKVSRPSSSACKECLRRASDLRSSSSSPVLVSLHLAHTKTGNHQWAQVRSPLVAELLRIWFEFARPISSSSSVFGLSVARLRSSMGVAISLLGLSPKFTPHSLRHGHATHDYESGATVQDIAVRGRWRCLDSLLIYVQSGPALAVQFRPSSSLSTLASASSSMALQVILKAVRHRFSPLLHKR
jgi:integrase